MRHLFIIVLLVSFAPIFLVAQDVSIFNRGLEDTPRRGATNGFNYTRSVDGWFDCGTRRFPAESPPDIHPNNYWKNNIPPAKGRSYVGLVVRQNDTWESISQGLDIPLKKDKCYSFSIYLARSDDYWSVSRDINNQITSENDDPVNYVEPAVFRMWGGSVYCAQEQLIAESTPIDHSDWRVYEFKIEPKSDINFILIEAFYVVPTFFPYNGHILIDELSDFKEIPCSEEDEIIEDIIAEVPVKKENTKTTNTEPKAEIVVVKPEPEKYVEPKIMTELRNPDKLKLGVPIRIRNLYFQADTSTISRTSHGVLNELVRFMKKYDSYVIELGGHTNAIPPSAYCDSLSLVRAERVGEYLVKRGVSQDQIKCKGYGKRKPIASNETTVGRARNQRVEIKFLSR